MAKVWWAESRALNGSLLEAAGPLCAAAGLPVGGEPDRRLVSEPGSSPWSQRRVGGVGDAYRWQRDDDDVGPAEVIHVWHESLVAVDGRIAIEGHEDDRDHHRSHIRVTVDAEPDVVAAVQAAWDRTARRRIPCGPGHLAFDPPELYVDGNLALALPPGELEPFEAPGAIGVHVTVARQPVHVAPAGVVDIQVPMASGWSSGHPAWAPTRTEAPGFSFAGRVRTRSWIGFVRLQPGDTLVLPRYWRTVDLEPSRLPGTIEILVFPGGDAEVGQDWVLRAR